MLLADDEEDEDISEEFFSAVATGLHSRAELLLPPALEVFDCSRLPEFETGGRAGEKGELPASFSSIISFSEDGAIAAAAAPVFPASAAAAAAAAQAAYRGFEAKLETN